LLLGNSLVRHCSFIARDLQHGSSFFKIILAPRKGASGKGNGMARLTASERRAAALTALEAAKRDLVELEAKDSARIGRLAVRAGLADLDLDDASLLTEFKTIVARFRDKGGKPARSGEGSAAANGADASAGTDGGPDAGHT